MAQDTATFELREPAPPDHLLPGDPALPLWISLALALALFTLAAGLLIWRKHRPRKPDPVTLRRLAYQEAVAALGAVSAPTVRAAAVQTSLILRRCLAAALADPALYETHEEFISRSDSLNALAEPAREACRSGFASLAAIKYSPAGDHGDPAAIVAAARSLLETLHPGFHG
jgi:hypothetical protein